MPYRHVPNFPDALLPGARDRRRSFAPILLAGDRGFESASLQQGVCCEPADFVVSGNKPSLYPHADRLNHVTDSEPLAVGGANLANGSETFQQQFPPLRNRCAKRRVVPREPLRRRCHVRLKLGRASVVQVPPPAFYPSPYSSSRPSPCFKRSIYSVCNQLRYPFGGSARGAGAVHPGHHRHDA
jgi:hypothetical protein